MDSLWQELMNYGFKMMALSVHLYMTLYVRFSWLKWGIDTVMAWGRAFRRVCLGIKSAPSAPFITTAYLRKDRDIFGNPALVHTEVVGSHVVPTGTDVVDPLYIYLPNDRRAIYRHLPVELSTITTLFRSPTKFLAVEYAHPDYGYALSLPCPTNAYFADNEVYSPTFVRRALLQTYGVFVPFDDRYTIHVVDHKLEYFSLNAQECVVFLDDGYVVTPLSHLTRSATSNPAKDI
jgi:hypothetical protein